MISYLRGIVRNGGKGRLGVGLEMFRLDTNEEVDLTEEESEVVSELDEDEHSTTALIRVYEQIGEDFWTGGGITAKSFAEQLDSLGSIKKLNVHVNCLGGDAHVAQAIYNIIRDYDCEKKTTYIDGVCASAATLIASAADEVIARDNTNYMVHYPWSICVGNSIAMSKAAEDLEKITVPIINVYKAQVKGKIREPKIRALMEAETWMTAEEAKDYGFVDKVKGKIKPIAKASKSQIFCSGQLMNIAKYHYQNVPDYPEKRNENKKETKMANQPNVSDPGQNANANAPVPPVLTPELRASIIADERKRLGDLDAMMGPGLETVIANAKAKGLQPNDIAMECLTITRAQVTSGQQLSALTRDGASISNVPAGDAPTGKPESKKDKGVKILTNAQATVSKRFQLTNNNGVKN